MDVVSPLMALAMPKSMSFSWPSTSRKLAGFRSLWTMRCSCTPATACGVTHRTLRAAVLLRLQTGMHAACAGLLKQQMMQVAQVLF
jgi:hypothetical protein